MMADYKQIRLNPDVRALLDDYKMQGESYSIAIGRLFKENELLKESQELLMMTVMKNDEFLSIPRDWQRISFVIELMSLHMDFESDDDKIHFFKTMLGDALKNNSSRAYHLIEDFIKEFPEQEETFLPILEWLQDNYKI